MAEVTEERKTEQEKLIHTITEEMARSKILPVNETAPTSTEETTSSVDLPIADGTSDGNSNDINGNDELCDDSFMTTTMPIMTRYTIM